MTAILSSTTVRTALIDYQKELIRLQLKYPDVYKENNAVIESIDEALYEIEGNITEVMISPITCELNP